MVYQYCPGAIALPAERLVTNLWYSCPVLFYSAGQLVSMADVFTRSKRSQVMSLIRGRGNKDTELVLAKLLRAEKITGWRRHKEIRIQKPGVRNFKVKPDFVFKEVRLALFVDGCFWHGCPKHATKPKSNRSFWKKKLEGNIARDRRVNRVLRRAGWRVVRIWECRLRKDPLVCLRRIKQAM